MIEGIVKVLGFLILLFIVVGIGFMIYMLVTDLGFLVSESDSPISKGENNSTVVWDNKTDNIKTIYIKKGSSSLILNEVGDSVTINNSSDYEVSADFTSSYQGTYRGDLTTIDNGTIL